MHKSRKNDKSSEDPGPFLKENKVGRKTRLFGRVLSQRRTTSTYALIILHLSSFMQRSQDCRRAAPIGYPNTLGKCVRPRQSISKTDCWAGVMTLSFALSTIPASRVPSDRTDVVCLSIFHV